MIATHLKDEVQVMNFIDVQLRPNVRIQDAEVQAYYQAKLVPDLQQSGAQSGSRSTKSRRKSANC